MLAANLPAVLCLGRAEPFQYAICSATSGSISSSLNTRPALPSCMAHRVLGLNCSDPTIDTFEQCFCATILILKDMLPLIIGRQRRHACHFATIIESNLMPSMRGGINTRPVKLWWEISISLRKRISHRLIRHITRLWPPKSIGRSFSWRVACPPIP